MKANVLYGVGDLRFVDVALPRCKEGEVLVKVRAAGICGSDVARVFTTGTYHFPTIIGHEFAGEVVETRDARHRHLSGKRVAVFPLKPCFTCCNCKEGKYELCLDYDYIGSRCDGGFAEYVAVPVWNLLCVPDTISMEAAAMLEPASVAMHALIRSRMRIGDAVAVIGPGTIGMILCRLAMIAGAKDVFLIGRSKEKLDFAVKYGIRNVCDSSVDDVKEWIDSLTGHKGVDIAVEGTGASSSMNLALDVVKSTGTILALGNPLDDMLLQKKAYWKILRKQLSLYGTWNSSYGTGRSDWTQVLDLLEKGRIDLEKLITHRLPLSELSKGLDIMKDKNTYSNKVMIINE